MTSPIAILLTGATGHVGGRLLARLETEGAGVRCLVRDPARLEGVAAATEVVEGDVTDAGSLRAAFDGIEVAYYLVHSLETAGGVGDVEAEGAETFGHAAAEAGVGRIVYLGGIAPPDEELSDHMASRVRVGELLRESGVPTVELRASIVIGDGSLSFEIVRTLVDWLPLLVLPDWVDNEAQPIALDDVVAYLAAARDLDLEGSAVVEIGGADRVTYRAILDEYARQTDARRTILSLPVPQVLAPSSAPVAWASSLLPEDARTSLSLLESLRHATVVSDPEPSRALGVEPRGLAAAIEAALEPQTSRGR